jgi:hypothetical protein
MKCSMALPLRQSRQRRRGDADVIEIVDSATYTLRLLSS